MVVRPFASQVARRTASRCVDGRNDSTNQPRPIAPRAGAQPTPVLFIHPLNAIVFFSLGFEHWLGGGPPNATVDSKPQ